MSTTREHGHSKNPIKCAPSTLLIQFSSIISIRLWHQLHITGSRLLLGVTFEAFQTHTLSERCWSHYAQRIIKDAHASRLSTQSTVNPSSIIIISFGRPSHRNSPFPHTQLVTAFLPLVPSAVAHSSLQRRWPGHAGLLEPRPVTRVHGIRALHLSVVMPVGVRVTAVFDFDGGPWLSPQMLGRLEGRLSLPGNRQRKRQALFRARWWFHHSAKLIDVSNATC